MTQHKPEIEEKLNQIEDEFKKKSIDCKIYSFIGSGISSTAYRAIINGKSCILKITANKQVIDSTKNILKIKNSLGEYSKHIIDVYYMFEVDLYNDYYYVIVTEELEKLNPYLRKVMYEESDSGYIDKYKLQVFLNYDSLRRFVSKSLDYFSFKNFLDVKDYEILVDTLSEEILNQARNDEDEIYIDDKIEEFCKDRNIHYFSKKIKDVVESINEVYKTVKYSKPETMYSSNYGIMRTRYRETDEHIFDMSKELPEVKSFFKCLELLKTMGIEWADLHRNNVMQRDDGTIVLFDFDYFDFNNDLLKSASKIDDLYNRRKSFISLRPATWDFLVPEIIKNKGIEIIDLISDRSSFSIVYRALYKGKSVVLKITRSKNDAEAILKLNSIKDSLGKYSKHIMNIFDYMVEKYDDLTFYIFIVEELLPLNNHIKSVLFKKTSDVESRNKAPFNIIKDPSYIDELIKNVFNINNVKTYLSEVLSEDDIDILKETIKQQIISSNKKINIRNFIILFFNKRNINPTNRFMYFIELIENSVNLIYEERDLFPASYLSNDEMKEISLIIPESRSLLELLNILKERYNIEWEDLRSPNLMERKDGTVVISDPGCFYV